MHGTENLKFFFFFDGATARGGPWPLLQYAPKPLDPLLCLSIHLFLSFSGAWTRHPAISFLVPYTELSKYNETNLFSKFNFYANSDGVTFNERELLYTYLLTNKY
jgi:hypothetical protein